MGSRLQAVDLLQRKNVWIQGPDGLHETIEVHSLVAGRAAMQDVERGHAHGKKVLIISMNDSAAGPTIEDTGLRSALKQSASALKADGVAFALGGGYALWASGAPEPIHDVDMVVPEDEVQAAVDSLSAAGFSIERPPEDWLFKAYLDDDLVDVLHRLAGVPVERELIDTATEREILGVRIPVLPPTPIMIAKLLSLSEHYADFASLLPPVRAVREQLDWPAIASAVNGHPFAEAFLVLVERLGITGTGVSESEPSSG
jgi:hypothetical protein